MAEQNAAPEGGDDGLAAPDVLELDTPLQPEAEVPPAPPTIEEVAGELGWVPKDKFKGKEDDWKPAVDFIREGKNIQKGLAKDVKGLRSQMDTMAKTSAAILQERLEAQRAELTAKYDQAVEDGDPATARQIGKRLDGIDQQAAQIKPGISSEAEEWVSRNTWFKTNPMARSVALATAQTYADDGKSVAEQLQAAEEEVRRAYPNLFTTTKAPAGVSQPGSRSASQSARAKGFADMPREAQEIAKDMVDRGVIKAVDDYSRNYWASEGKSK